MLPSLLYKDNRPGYKATASNKKEMLADFGFNIILESMAKGSPGVKDAAQSVIFQAPVISKKNIIYRQEVLKDALKNADSFFDLHHILEAGLTDYEDARKKSQPGYARFAPMIEQVRSASDLLGRLLILADKTREGFENPKLNINSSGLAQYIDAYRQFYSQGFILSASHENKKLGQISEKSCITLGTKPGLGLKGTAYTIRSIEKADRFKGNFKKNTINLDTLASQLKGMELRDAALAKLLSILNTVIRQTSTDLKDLLFELSFYVGCINLHKAISAIGLHVCYPKLDAHDALRFIGLEDINLAVSQNIIPVDNSINLDNIKLTLITGANQGGKSTLLRSIGCAQLMAQCGMFVTAKEFSFSVRPRIFTHFCKPEDASDSGKLDEELTRLGGIIDKLEPQALLLMNESFSSTIEQEGTAIAHEIIDTLCAIGIKVIFVTHLYTFAHSMENDALLLRAERKEDGSRTFLIQPGVSLPTSHGMDLFREVLGIKKLCS